MRPAACGFDCSTRNDVAVHRALDVQALQHRGDHLHVFGARAADVDLAAGHRRDDRPAARLDVVAPQLGARRRAGVPPPSTRIVDVPAPVMPTPSLLRNSQSSTTCGSQAAWRISEMPGAAAAASSAVSVPVTDAS